MITLHVVSSLDGIIARNDNTVSWLDGYAETYDRGVSDANVADALEPIDCFVMGSRTYEHALEIGWPYGDIPTIVVTSRNLPVTRTSVELYSGELEQLVNRTLSHRYRNIWVVGGAVLGRSFLKLGLVDQIRLSIAPILLGRGLRLFDDSTPEARWHLKDVVAYKTGFVELVYSSQ